MKFNGIEFGPRHFSAKRQAGWMAVALAAAFATGAQARVGGVGVNLAGFSYFSQDMPLLDAIKRSDVWFTACTYNVDPGCNGFAAGASANNTQEAAKLDLDDNGWPRSLPSATDGTVKYRFVTKQLFTHNGLAHPAGKYIVLYEGSGTLEYGANGSKVAAESRPGRDVVEVRHGTDAGVVLKIKATDPANYLRNIRMIYPGGTCTNAPAITVNSQADCDAQRTGTYQSFEKLSATQIWHPSYVADLKGFRSIRFLDWAKANNNEIVSWSQRPNLGDSTWTGQYCVPLEAMLDLARTTDSDAWINVPFKVDDEYVKQMARTAKRYMGSKRTLVLEYGNEPWNYAFRNSHWVRQQAIAAWPDEVAKGANEYALAASWYAMRASQICQIVKGAIGKHAAQVRCVVNGQATNPWYGDQLMQCPFAVATLGRPCNQVVDALAIGPYFGNYINDPAVRGTVSKWYAEPDGGVSKFFEEILGENAAGQKVVAPLYGVSRVSLPEGALALAKKWVAENVAVAAKYGKSAVAYEGGQHLLAAGGDQDATYRELTMKVNADPRMKLAYARMLEDWKAAGGQTYTLFNYIGKWNPYGSWGLKQAIDDEASPKWQAVKPYRDAVKGCWWAGCER